MLTVNGDNDHPQAFEPLVATLKSLAIPHETVVLEDTRHNLSQYDERSGSRLAQFLGEQLKRDQTDDE